MDTGAGRHSGDWSGRLRTVGPRGYLCSDSPDERVVGYGDARFQVREIPRRQAVETIVRRHYSQRVVNNSYIHLGVFYNQEYVGALQFGYAMNPASGGKIVEGTGNRAYLELNRMWIDDSVPKNAESKAISYAIRYLRKTWPHVQWVQSFADERCSRLGVVYQACNFLYCGYHVTKFYRLDAEWYHEMLLTAHNGKGGRRGEYLRANLQRAVEHKFRQFRYIYFLDPAARERLRLKVLPYPKPEVRPS